MKDKDGNDLPFGESFEDLQQAFMGTGLSTSQTIDTSPAGIERLIAALKPKAQLALVVSNRTSPNHTGVKAALAAVVPAKLPAPLANSSLGFLAQIQALTGEAVSPAELANAVFRVSLTPHSAKIDSRPDAQLLPNERLTISSLANKFSRRTTPATLEEATQLAIWRGTAQPLRF